MFEFYAAHEHQFAQVQLLLFMVGMGLTLWLDDFVGVFRKPRSFFVAFVVQIAIIPFAAVGIIAAFGLDGGYALGLVLVAAMPGGALSKMFTYLGRGNLPLSISLTVISTLATLVTVPITLDLFASQYVPADFAMPVLAIVEQVGLYLLLPLVVGMLMGQVIPEQRKWVSKIFIRLGFAAVVVIVICSLGSGRIKPLEPRLTVPIAIILFCLVGMQINMLPFRVLGWPRADCVSAGIEASMRNMNLALLLKTVLFPETPDVPATTDKLARDVMYVILFYAAAAMGCGLLLALNFRRLTRRDEARAKLVEPAVS